MTENRKNGDSVDQESQPEGPEGVSYGFLVLKLDDGNVAIKPVEELGIPKPPSMDDISATCFAVSEQVKIDKTATAVGQILMQAAQKAQTDSKLVIPK